jgi:glycosyltransferase involved in cell wall biosynthesis
MSRLKVLHLTFDMAIAGTEQVIRQLVENTDRDRFEVAICCIDGRIGDLGQKLQASGHTFFTLRRGSGFDRTLIRDLRALIRDQHFDVLHCHQYTPYSYGLFASFGTGVRVIFTEHGRFYPDSYKWKRFLLNPVLSLFTDAITAISQATNEALVRYENFPRRKIRTLYNGIRENTPEETAQCLAEAESLRAELGLAPDCLVFGTISRLDPIKNQEMMIRAFARTWNRHPACHLLIVGDGPQRQKLEQLTGQMNLQQHITFTGFKVDPKPWFAVIDAFLLSSLSEGTSMTLLEAMAFAKPSVVTGVGGNPEIVVDGQTGLVTPNQDTDAFADAMLRIASEPALAGKLGEHARARFLDRFTVGVMCAQYQALYQELVGESVRS